MNLTRRGPRFTFQKRVPNDLSDRFGTSPIRLPLPPCGAREAQRLAALLGGQLEVRFMEARLASEPEDDDPRDAVIRELMQMLERAHGMGRPLTEKKGPTVELRHLTERLHGQDSLRGELTDFAARLDRLQDHGQDLVVRQAAPAVGDEILARLAAMEQHQLAATAASQAQVTALAEAVDRSTAAKLGPLFSEAWPEYLAHQVEGNPTSKFMRYTLPAAAKAWIEDRGDRPLGAYEPDEMEKFARLMARVPANKAKLRRFSEKSFKAAADENAGLRSPYPTLSQTTLVRQYFMPIKAAFAWMCKKHKILSPFAGEKLKAPRGARLAEPRRPLTVPEFVAVLSEAAQRPRPDERWLPLLGYATGCRLGELVYLQGRDLRWRRDAKAWTFDLRDTLLVNGRSVERPLKTDGSRRVIALPAFLVETGFVEWARDREGFIFDELHRRSKDPSSAASKRMARLFTSAGVDDAGEVFHSLRHTTQDWLRGLKVDRRTRLLQGGWSLNGEDVAERYGLKHLREDEIAELARCEPPPEIAAAAEKYRRSR